MDKNLLPRLFISYRKFLYDCDVYLLQKNISSTDMKRRKQMLNFEWNTWKYFEFFLVLFQEIIYILS